MLAAGPAGPGEAPPGRERTLIAGHGALTSPVPRLYGRPPATQPPVYSIHVCRTIAELTPLFFSHSALQSRRKKTTRNENGLGPRPNSTCFDTSICCGFVGQQVVQQAVSLQHLDVSRCVFAIGLVVQLSVDLFYSLYYVVQQIHKNRSKWSLGVNEVHVQCLSVCLSVSLRR